MERKGGKDRGKKEREEGGRRWRQREGGRLEIKSGGERVKGERVVEKRKEEVSERKLKVSARTVWSSELDGDTAAVTSVLISHSAG